VICIIFLQNYFCVKFLKINSLNLVPAPIFEYRHLSLQKSSDFTQNWAIEPRRNEHCFYPMDNCDAQSAETHEGCWVKIEISLKAWFIVTMQYLSVGHKQRSNCLSFLTCTSFYIDPKAKTPTCFMFWWTGWGGWWSCLLYVDFFCKIVLLIMQVIQINSGLGFSLCFQP